jgi:hypothetical protein
MAVYLPCPSVLGLLKGYADRSDYLFICKKGKCEFRRAGGTPVPLNPPVYHALMIHRDIERTYQLSTNRLMEST